jgi:uncharacterized repeat protein (TIGR02543 family)
VTVDDDSPAAVTVNYYNLTVSKGANAATATGTGIYLPGEAVSISATASAPVDGYNFAGWSQGGFPGTLDANTASSTFRMAAANADATLSAAFAAKSNITLAFAVDPAESGTISPDAASLPVSPAAAADAVARRTASPATGYHFVNWTNDRGDDSPVTTAGMTPNRGSGAWTAGTYTAHFTANIVTVNIKKDGLAWDSEKTFRLKGVSPTDDFTGTASGAAAQTFTNVPNGTYEVYDGANLTGTQVTVSDDSPAAATVNYYTLSVAVANTNGTVTPVSDVILLPGQAQTITATPAAGYSFTGWTLSGAGADSTAVSDLTATGLSATATMGGGATAITADFAIKSTGYAVFYAMDGGGPTPTKPDTIGWATAGLVGAANPTKPGYTFSGWTSSQETSGITSETTYGVAANGKEVSQITLTAHWTELGHVAIGFTGDGNGTVSPIAPEDLNPETGQLEAASRAAIPNDRYHFVSWTSSLATDATDLANITLTPSKNTVSGKSVWQNATYTAHFTANVVTVNINRDGAEWDSGRTFTLRGTGGAADFTASASGPSPLTFTGVLNGTYEVHDGTQRTGVMVTVNDDSPAAVTVNYYTVSFSQANAAYTAAIRPQTVLDGDRAQVPGGLAINDKYGYKKFLGWFADPAAGSAAFDFETVAVTRSRTLYARWQDAVKVRFHSGNPGYRGTGGPAYTQYIYLDERPGALDPTDPRLTAGSYYPEYGQKKFHGWFESNNAVPGRDTPVDFPLMITADDGSHEKNLYAVWEESLKVTFLVQNNAYSGAPNVTQYIVEGDAPVDPNITGRGLVDGRHYPEYGDRRFLGWYDAPAGGEKFDFGTDNISVDTVLYGHWEQYWTVTFVNLNGNTVPALTVLDGTYATTPNTLTGIGGDFATTSNELTPGDFVFYGWSADPEATGGGTPGQNTAPFDFAATPITSDTIIYGVWEPRVYSVIFEVNCGVWETRATTATTMNIFPFVYEYIPENTGGLYGSANTDFDPGRDAPAVNPTRANYVFTGWNSNQSGGGEAPAARSSGNFTYYAQWEPVSYPIIYVWNDSAAYPASAPGVNAPDSYDYESRSFPIPIGEPKRSGYVFIGYTATGGHALEYPTMPFSIKQGAAGPVTLYAYWDAISYAITYELNGGTGKATNPVGYSADGAVLLIADPTKTGYDFIGWTAEADAETGGRWDLADGAKNLTIPTGAYGDVRLTAHWEAIEYSINYELDGGINDAANPVFYTVESAFPIAIADPTKTGYLFDGWTAATAAVLGDAANSLTVETPGRNLHIPAGTMGDISLAAHWTIFADKGGEVDGGDGDGNETDGGDGDGDGGDGNGTGGSGNETGGGGGHGFINPPTPRPTASPKPTTRPTSKPTSRPTGRPGGGGADHGDSNEFINPFDDVSESDWFYDDIAFVFARGLFKGISEREFGPDLPTTRGMIVTVLYRLTGQPDVSGTSPFVDVESGQYYADAVSWGSPNGIIKGVDATHYEPDVNITRQDLAAIFGRYAKFRKLRLPHVRIGGVFADEAEISGYAVPAVDELHAGGILEGRPGNIFDPLGEATRAEFAAVLHRFIEAAQ